MKKRFYTLLLVAFALLMTVYIALRVSHWMALPTVIPVAICAYALLAMLLFFYMNNALRINPKRFATAMMGATAVKMLLTMAFLGTYLYIDRSQKITVALGVFVIYIVYTIALLVPFASGNNTQQPTA
jgi:hypothetical protein